MDRQEIALGCRAGTLRLVSLISLTGFALLPSTSLLRASDGVIDIGPATKSCVPRWDARGLGPLPRQAVACLDLSEDGNFLAAGTIAPPGEPNLFLLEESGEVVQQHRAGLRWLNEVTVSGDGRVVGGLSTTPEGTSGDTPRLHGFRGGEELTQVSGELRFRDFRPGTFLFHYGDHSNHLSRVMDWAGDRWVVVGDDLAYWISPLDSRVTQRAHLGQGVTTALAVNPEGVAVVGRISGIDQPSGASHDLLVMRPDKQQPIIWARPASSDVDPSPRPERGVYGPPVPPYRDVRFQAPLAVAVNSSGKLIAVADYEGWQRMFQPRDGSVEKPYGTRFMPSRPTIHVYDAEGKTVRRIGPDAFPGPFWCDLLFSADGKELLLFPHSWTCRGLGGEPRLPADEDARTLYILEIATGGLGAVRFPDAIASVDTGGAHRTVVSCWNHKVYLLDQAYRPVGNLPRGLDVGAASLVRMARDGKRIAVATAAGTVRMLDGDGRELWQTDLNQAARPADKPWTKNQRPGRVAPGIWRTNGGLAHSDMGSQNIVEVPQGLILIDPNAGASFEQNWALIEGAGFDPMQVRYVLITHEHGDHAPGAYLWRVVTGAQVVASAESAYMLQHHIPDATGYGFHPPVPVDVMVTEDCELDLAGLKIKAMRIAGHTFGSMGYALEKNGQTYVATGDLIMPGGTLGYSGSLDFCAEDVLDSLKKLELLQPDVILGGHGGGDPRDFIAAGIEAGEATGWSRMQPPKPDPLYRFTHMNYLVVAWLERIQSAAYGDIDGDGLPDVAVLVPRGRGSAVKIYVNRGGRFKDSPDAVVELPELSRGWKLRLVQLTGGEVADLFVSSEDRAILLRPQKEGLEFSAVPLPVIRGSQVATGDFNGDGSGDLVVGARFVSGYYLACRRDDSTFEVRQTEFPTHMYMDIELADVNGDKREDLLASCGDVFLRQPDGSLAKTPTFHLTPPPGTPQGWAFLAAADFDADGWTDAALLAQGGDGATVWLYRNTRNPQAPFRDEPSAKFVATGAVVNRDGPTAADFSGDGVPDLVLSSRDDRPAVHVLTGAPLDGLDPKRAISVELDYVPHFDTRLGVTDFNGDGRLDLAGFGRSSTGAVGVYLWLHPER